MCRSFNWGCSLRLLVFQWYFIQTVHILHITASLLIIFPFVDGNLKAFHTSLASQVFKKLWSQFWQAIVVSFWFRVSKHALKVETKTRTVTFSNGRKRNNPTKNAHICIAISLFKYELVYLFLYSAPEIRSSSPDVLQPLTSPSFQSNQRRGRVKPGRQRPEAEKRGVGELLGGWQALPRLPLPAAGRTGAGAVRPVPHHQRYVASVWTWAQWAT